MYSPRRSVDRAVVHGMVVMIWYSLYLFIKCLTLIERTYFYTYSCVIVSLVGIVTTLFLSDVSLYYCYQGF
jgi:hypothetical protein